MHDVRTEPLFEPLSFRHGPAMANRFMLAPLTNKQSRDDGSLSDEEFRWLAMRAEGGYGAAMTAAACVQANGLAMGGQLCVYDDRHTEPLARVARAMRDHGVNPFVQLYHSGHRANREITGCETVGPYDETETGSRGLSRLEVQQLIEDFILAAERAQRAGFAGVDLHSAHGHMLAQFLNPVRNLRGDGYGGSLDDRLRALVEILVGIRERCGPDFTIGVRLSPERFDMRLAEIRTLSERLMTGGLVDFIDYSLWDVFKEPVEEAFKGRPLVAWVADIPRGEARIGVAGKLTDGARVRACIAAGCDFVEIGRGAILHHDFPRQVRHNPDFTSVPLPVSTDYLHAQAVSEAFIGYLRNWDGFVADSGPGLFSSIGDLVEGGVNAGTTIFRNCD